MSCKGYWFGENYGIILKMKNCGAIIWRVLQQPRILKLKVERI